MAIEGDICTSPYRPLKCKVKEFLFGSYNVRSLNESGKFHELIHGCQKQNLDIVAIQEHRWKTKETYDTITSSNNAFTMIYTSADSKGNGGVGILIKKEYFQLIQSIKIVSPRILGINLNSNPKVTIVSIYAPTSMAAEELLDDFYNTLENYLISIPIHNLTIVGGDFNARIGYDSHLTVPRIIGKNTFTKETNETGERLIGLCLNTSFRPSSQRFPHRPGRQWTWMHPNKKVAQIDHILINSKWVNSLRNCRAYSTINLNSDHRILVAAIKVSLRSSIKKNTNTKTIKYDWRQLATNKTLQKQFEILTTNVYETLNETNDETTVPPKDGIQEKYNKLESTLKTTAERVLKPKENNREPWVTDETNNLIDQKIEARKKYRSDRTEENKNLCATMTERLKNSFKEDKKTYLERLCQKIEKSEGINNAYEIYQTIKILSGKLKQKPIILEQTSDCKSKTDLWKEYFCNLLNANNQIQNHENILPAPIDLPINLNNITVKETRDALFSMKNGKASGNDYIVTVEALKYSSIKVHQLLADICNDVFNTAIPPPQWLIDIIIPIPKKGNKTDIKNYRGISLMSIAAKIYNKIILNRIYDIVNPILRPNQTGYRKNMSCIDQIHTLRRIIEGAKIKQLPLITTFIDFQKAFDSINRQSMWRILRHYGIPEKVVKAINCLYSNSKSKVRIGNEYSDEFLVNEGVRQGDTLAPFLFIIVLDYVMKKTTANVGFNTDLN